MQVGDRVEVVDAERVGGTHRRHQGRDAASPVERLAGGGLQAVDADVVLQVRRHLDDGLLAQTEPPGDVQAAVVALRRRQNDAAAGGHAILHRVGERLLDAELRPVEHRPGAAEREDAGRARRLVADEPRDHGRDRRLGQHEAVRRIVGDEVGVVDGGQQRSDDARNGRWGYDVDLRPRMSPDRHALEPADEQVGDVLDAAALLVQLGLLRRRVVQRPRPAEQRHLRLQVVDLVEGAQDGEDEVGVVLPVRHRRGERVPHLLEQLVVRSLGHAVGTACLGFL